MTTTPSKSDGEKLVPQQSINPARRKGESGYEGATRYTDAYWHPSKAISIANILGFVVLLMGGYAAYDDTIEKLNNVMNITATKVAVLETSIIENNKDRIPSTTVLQMFETRDIQIQNLAVQIVTMQERQNETNRLLTNIYREMPKQASD